MTIEWGPEIPVNGKRPGWLADGTPIKPVDNECEWMGYAVVQGVDHKWWPDVTAIRLPADHPHYQQADTVTLARIREVIEARKAIYRGKPSYDAETAAEREHTITALEYLASELGCPPVPEIDRFMAAHPTADRATAEKALEWGREGA